MLDQLLVIAGVTILVMISPGPDMLVVYAVPTGQTELNAADLRSSMQQAIRTKLNPLFKVHDVIITKEAPNYRTA